MCWFGFWLFAIVFIVCDTYIFSTGRDSFFQYHKTKEEKEIQILIINKLKLEVELKEVVLRRSVYDFTE